ncbi:MAG: MarR family winged helix-turn-helix transcriptional regulator [Microthrixaceae bacterium]
MDGRTASPGSLPTPTTPPDPMTGSATAGVTPAVACPFEDERILTFGLLLEAHARLARVLDAELRASDGITLQTFEVLLRVARSPHGRVSMSELANGVALTTGGVTRLADRLEADRLVERHACPTDRRVVHLVLTDRGREVLDRATANHLDALERHVQGRLDPADLPALHRALDVLRSDPALPAD